MAVLTDCHIKDCRNDGWLFEIVNKDCRSYGCLERLSSKAREKTAEVMGVIKDQGQDRWRIAAEKAANENLQKTPCKSSLPIVKSLLQSIFFWGSHFWIWQPLVTSCWSDAQCFLSVSSVCGFRLCCKRAAVGVLMHGSKCRKKLKRIPSVMANVEPRWAQAGNRHICGGV